MITNTNIIEFVKQFVREEKLLCHGLSLKVDNVGEPEFVTLELFGMSAGNIQVEVNGHCPVCDTHMTIGVSFAITEVSAVVIDILESEDE